MDESSQQALWASQVLVDCLREAGDDVSTGFAAAEYILSTSIDSYDYPRNSSNQFLPKLTIAAAARDDLEYKRLRDSLPEDQRWKLDSKVALLQGGGVVHHPSEAPGLGVDINGVVADPKWAMQEHDERCKSEWQAREAARDERRRLTNKAVRSFRSKYKPLDRVRSLLKRAGATPSELRSLDRTRHELNTDKISEQEFERQYEEVMERIHLRIDEECLRDPEAGFPDQYAISSLAAFAVDRRGVSHRASGPDGGQFVPTGQEGPESAGESHQSRSATTASGTPGDSGGGGSVQGGPIPTGGGVESADTGSNFQQVDTAGQDQGIAPGNQTTGAIPDRTTDPVKLASAEKFNRRLRRYIDHFRSNNDNETAEWLEEIQEHVIKVGIEAAYEALGEEKRADIGKIAYKGSGEHEEDSDNTRYIRKYLARAGLYFQATDPLPGVQTMASHPIPESERHKYKPGDIIPGNTTFNDKLEESKHLPGLESTEDLDVIMGAPTSHITQDVITNLDKRYGKGKWIIKSYGDEAFAGFGIFFPERVQQLKQNANDTILGVNRGLKQLGLELARDEAGKLTGFTDGTQVSPFQTRDNHPVPNLPDGWNPIAAQNYIRRLGLVARRAETHLLGPKLPRSAEENLYNKFGVSLYRLGGKIAGVLDNAGSQRKFGTPEFERYKSELSPAKQEEIDRAIEGVENPVPEGSIRFMAQPAFETVGSSDLNRALGMTWGNSEEGRVHVVVRNGIAKAIPYGTLDSKSDGFPVIFHNDETRAMEKAAEDAIASYPESERKEGAVYGTDVIRVKGGWKVVEGNAAVEGGSSSWLEHNPLVMDAYVSHLVGRDPAHVQFVRNLLRDRMTNTRNMVNQPPGGVKLSTENQPRKPAGTPEGGRWTKYGEIEDEINTLKHGRLEVNYVLYKSEDIKGSTKLDLPNYWQEDYHSCGFVAALTVARHLKLGASAQDVLKAVRPSINYGVDRYKLKAALEKLGVEAKYKKNLTVEKLRELVEAGTAVIVSVWPEGWYSDHWTVVQGFDDEGVHLTNFGTSTLEEFEAEWSDMDMRGQGGSKEGIVCTIPPAALSAAFASVDQRGVEHRGKGDPRGGQFVHRGEGEADVVGSSSGGRSTPTPQTPQTPQTPKLPAGGTPLEETDVPGEQPEDAGEAPTLTQAGAESYDGDYTPDDVALIEALISFYPQEQQDIARRMMYGKTAYFDPLRGGQEVSTLLSLEGGDRGVYKKSSDEPELSAYGIPQGTYYKREVAAGVVAHMLGFGDLVPVTVPRKSQDTYGSMQSFVDNAQTAYEHGTDEDSEFGSDEDVARAALFDYIIGSEDRHSNNWMISSSETLTSPPSERPSSSTPQGGDIPETGEASPVVEIPPEGVEGLQSDRSTNKMVLIDNSLSFPLKHRALNFVHTQILNRAIKKNLPMPDVSKMAGVWSQVEAALTQSGLEPEAIVRTKQRFEWATGGGAKTLGDLQNPFEAANRSGKTIRDHMEHYGLLY